MIVGGCYKHGDSLFFIPFVECYINLNLRKMAILSKQTLVQYKIMYYLCSVRKE
jgi:hypothetical protein